MKKKILALALAAVLVVTGLTACGSKNDAKTDNGKVYRTVDEIKKSGTIKIGVFSDKNPFGYVDEKGEYQGIRYLLCKENSKRLRR